MCGRSDETFVAPWELVIAIVILIVIVIVIMLLSLKTREKKFHLVGKVQAVKL